MNPDELLERSQATQFTVGERAHLDAQYAAELENLEPLIGALNERLLQAKVELGLIAADVTTTGTHRGMHAHPITLDKVEATTDEATGIPLPAGRATVSLTPYKLVKNRMSSSGSEYQRVEGPQLLRPGNFSKIELEFRFIEDDQKHSPFSDGSTGHESTDYYRDPKNTLASELRWVDAGVHRLPGWRGDDSDKIIKYYREHYLPAREQHVADLEQSIAYIKSALQDPELNPWYPELLAARERAAEELRLAQEREAAEAATTNPTPAKDSREIARGGLVSAIRRHRR